MNSKNFKGKTVVITGASSGIGAAAALQFAKQGANLILTGRNTKQLEETKKNCVNEGLKDDQVVTVAGDIIKEDVQKKLIDEAVKHFGQLDILVNNAGMVLSSPLLQLKMEDFDRTHNVNLRATVSLTLMALPYLIKSKGNIVNVSSIASTRPEINALPYCMSKAGMDMFTKCLAFETAPQGVRVNSVNPGGVDTNIYRDIKLTPEQIEAMNKSIVDLHPLGRVGDVKEIADAILFLSSEHASFVTGQILGVCGGAGLGGLKF